MAKKQKAIFRNVANTLRAVGLRATVRGDVLTVQPFGRMQTFDISTKEGRQQWRKFYFATKGRVTRKRNMAVRRHRRKSDLQLLIESGWI